MTSQDQSGLCTNQRPCCDHERHHTPASDPGNRTGSLTTNQFILPPFPTPLQLQPGRGHHRSAAVRLRIEAAADIRQQPAASSRQQTTDNMQTTDIRQQTADSIHQTEDNRQQTAYSRHQTSDSRQQTADSPAGAGAGTSTAGAGGKRGSFSPGSALIRKREGAESASQCAPWRPPGLSEWRS